MRCLLFGMLTFLIHHSYAQFYDDFSDGNFSSNPNWVGDSANFRVQNETLFLNAPAQSDTSYLSTKSEIAINAEWSFRVGMDFNPSSSNYCKVFLASNSKNPTLSKKAYFVKIGGSQDEISLFRLDEKKEVKLIDGKDGRLSSNQVLVDIKVTRDSLFNWTLFIDTTGNQNYKLEGSALDSTYKTSEYFSLLCRYSSTRSDKFHFDNISIQGQIFIDLNKPKVFSNKLASNNAWLIKFTKKLDTASINPSNFHFSDELFPIDIKYDSSDASLLLSASKAFKHGRMHSLTIKGLKDAHGNQLKDTSINQVYNNLDSILFKDLIISEIMPDPSPSWALPESEYIELSNRSPHIYQLENWKIADIRDTFQLPKFLFYPKESITLISPSDSTLWSDSEALVLHSNIPSINNDADRLYLIDPFGNTIDSMQYSVKSFSKDKENGGWSLELVNPLFLCTDSSNWRASIDLTGGSPGYTNSVHQLDWNSQIAQITKPIQINDTIIEIAFSGHIGSSIVLKNIVSIEPELALDTMNINTRKNIELLPTQNLSKNTEYRVELSEFSDCLSRTNPISSVSFISPGTYTKNGLIINELLFNPRPGAYDFVELYNQSDQYLDLNGLYLANGQNDTISNIKLIQDSFDLLAPGSYAIFTEDLSSLLGQYAKTNIKSGRKALLPSYPDDDGLVYLLDPQHQILDVFHYNENMHLPFVKNYEGVSLERISPTSPTNNTTNWTSAASSYNYATPGLQNSQFYDGNTSSFKLVPDIFSPDNDGYQDLLNIHYHFNKAGYTGSISIYNAEGLLIKELIKQEIFETSGMYSWDGVDEYQTKAAIGYYLVVMEAYHADGNVKKEIASVVLAKRFQ